MDQERRSFTNRLQAGAAALAALAAGRLANAQSRAAGKFEAPLHEKDSWLDANAAKHRMLFDTTGADGVQKAMIFASNFLKVNKAEYGMADGDLALVIVVRYRSVSFGYSDAIWEKYGAAISKQTGFTDPKTKEAPKTNLYAAASGDDRGSLLELAKLGVQIAVCNTATRNMAGTIARATGGDAEKIYPELTANLVRGGRLVPAGIVVVGRAQERGYSLVTV